MQSTRVEISSRTKRALLFSGAGLIAACSLVVDTSGLSGGPTDAGREGSASDAPDVIDASPLDAGSDARWCAVHGPDGGFCDDFDDPGRTNPELHWDGRNVTEGGDLSIAPPGVLQVDFAANVRPPPGDCSYARLYKRMPQSATKWTFGFDVFLGDGKGGAFFDDAITDVVWHPNDDGFCQLYLEDLRGSSPGLDDDNHHRPLMQQLSVDTWHRVEITVDGNTGSVAITIDGANAFAGAQTIPPECKGNSTINLQHGLFCVRKNAGAVRLLYDNVTFVGE